MGKFRKKLICSLSILLAMALLFSGCSSSRTLIDGSDTGKNTDNSFGMVASWTATGLLNHYDSLTTCTVFPLFVVEGLYAYVRSTDEIYCQLAAEMPVHSTEDMMQNESVIGTDSCDYFKGNGYDSVPVTTIKIRDNAKWQNGDAFTAKDVWAYYYTIQPATIGYILAVVPVDDTTVKFIWNPMKEPADTVKELLIAQDISGTVKYDEFAEYVDPIYDILMKSPVNDDQSVWGWFNRVPSSEDMVEITRIKQEFFSYNPDWYVATGPFKLDKFSETQILLTKNEYHWNADSVKFDKIKLYSSSDLNQIYQLIEAGYIDYYDGLMQKDTLERLLASNEDLVNVKMYDPGATGLVFNLNNKLLADIRVRTALQYVFDRDAVKNAANPYAATSWYPLIGMAPSEAKKNMSEENFNALTQYSFDQEKAAALLREAGWEKKGDTWYADGEPVEFTLAAPPSHDISTTAAETVAAQLNAFGIKCKLILSANFFAEARSENSKYDMMLEWADLNASFSYPAGSYNQFNGDYAYRIHLERYPTDYEDTRRAGHLRLEFKGLNGDEKTYAFADYINQFYSLDENEVTYIVDVFNTGLSELCLGIQFFQNVTASTYNVGRINGIPFAELWGEDRNCTYVPELGTEDAIIMARTNLMFSKNYQLVYGIYEPNTTDKELSNDGD